MNEDDFSRLPPAALSELPQRALDGDVTDLLPFNFSKPTA
jgi:hypothetical protein